jgi:hypothetical protein
VHAQVIRARADRERLDELEVLVRRRLVCALRQEEGFCGALCLVDRDGSETLTVVLWETEDEAARPLVPCDAPFLQVLSTLAELGGSTHSSCRVWEVNARS